MDWSALVYRAGGILYSMELGPIPLDHLFSHFRTAASCRSSFSDQLDIQDRVAIQIDGDSLREVCTIDWCNQGLLNF